MADATAHDRKSPGLLLGYLPLILAAAAIIVMVLVVPSRAPDSAVTPGSGSAPRRSEVESPLQAQLGGATGSTQPSATSAPAAGPVMPATGHGAPPSTGGPATSELARGFAGRSAVQTPAAWAATDQSATGWGATVAPCSDRERQTDDDYAPPCFEFSGDNGGATSRGVTGDTITVTYRYVPDAHLLATLGALAGQSIDETAEDLWRTTEGLIEYFNENYQFYGRHIVLERFDGTGSQTAELTDAGQEAAANDALVAVDRGAFADVASGLQSTHPYAEALAAQDVITIGANYMPRDWYGAQGPYAWSSLPDCTLVAETAALVSNHILLPEPVAIAGEEFNGQPRRLGMVHPDNLHYTNCADHYVDIVEFGGFEIAQRQTYTLDLGATMSNATSIITRLKDADITSVGCACDPLMMQALATLAEQQDYHPEWFVVGVGFIDYDVTGQMIAANSGDQWSHSIGGSVTPAPLPFGESEAYRAYASVRDDEPSITVDLIYAQLLRLVIGLQMAGPDLTPESFEAGMYSYPTNTGGYLGGLEFEPNNHSGIIDIRLVYWADDLPSPFNGEPGTYIDDGQRYSDISQAPSQDELLALAAELGLLPDAITPPGSDGEEDPPATPASTAPDEP